jgi:hypothetical protein
MHLRRERGDPDLCRNLLSGGLQHARMRGGECLLSGEQRKTSARSEYFAF